MWMWMVLGCSPTPIFTPAPTSVPSTQSDCNPNPDVFDTNVAPILESRCGACHGSEPQFGAPYPLVTFEDVMTPTQSGQRRVDVVLDTLLEQTMPPSTAEPLDHFQLDTLTAWTSCGAQHAPTPDDLVASRPIWEADDTVPPESTPVELTADNEPVGIDVLDDYRTFDFSGFVDRPQYIRRIEPIIDEMRVLHHITVAYDGGVPYLYAWAPGTGPIQFPEGGLPIDSTTSVEIEIHYNNGAGVPNAVDSSGVRLWTSDPSGPAWGIVNPQAWNIDVPPNSSAEASTSCSSDMDFRIHAAMPHMHQVGDGFTHEVIRVDGTVESIIELEGWSFESQYIYDIGLDVFAGDRLRMQCRYNNPSPDRVVAGLNTDQEMCMNFMYVTPVEAADLCGSIF